MGHIYECKYLEHQNLSCNIQKVSAELYVDKKTGEVKEFCHNDNRSQNVRKLMQSLNQGRAMINTNVEDITHCRFLTVTYRQRDNYDSEPIPMNDTKRLYKDLDKLYKKLKYHFGKDIKYITCCEPQKSGSWHAHIILIFNEKAPYIPNEDLAKWWGQGFVRVERIKDDVDNVGAYLTAYLCDVEVSQWKNENPGCKVDDSNIKEVEVLDENGELQKKKYIKGARLHYYNNFFHPFRWSRNCEKPKIYRTEYETFKAEMKKADCDEPTFQKSIMLADDDFTNIIKYEYYNTKK